MKTALFIDFGSTYTKVAAVDLDEDRLIGRAQAPSTVDTDVSQGLSRALQLLKSRSKLQEEEEPVKLACSSAAGGLRMVAIGLIPHLTAEAANRAALGAGAKVVKVYGKELNDRTVPELEAIDPDIILLAGGIDGGNRDVIVHNARRIANSRVRSPVVVAGNVDAQEEVVAFFQQAGQETYTCDNVMPGLNELVVEPARARIQEVFISRIVHAKGLDRASDYVGQVIMPTPLAVLTMTELLAKGTEREPGLGEVVAVDIGGATTDIHSVAAVKPEESKAYVMDLAEPYAKRTVEGDLGLRLNAETVIQAVAKQPVPRDIARALATEEAELYTSYLASHTDALPNTMAEREMDTAMARAATFLAMERHAGYIDSGAPPRGYSFIQRGKDLSEVNVLLGTGGVFAFGDKPELALAGALANYVNPFSLRPKSPDLYADQYNVLYACGLLATVDPDKALRLMKTSLRPLPSPNGHEQ